MRKRRLLQGESPSRIASSATLYPESNERGFLAIYWPIIAL